MRRVSLNARHAQDNPVDSEITVVLFEFNHPELEKPIRLSTDNKDRLGFIDDQAYYGTRSSVFGANPVTDPYLCVIASALLPSDEDDVPAAGTLVLENLDTKMVDVVLSFRDIATVKIAIVMASTPNLIEYEQLGLEIVSADIDAGQILLSFSREEIEMEYFPSRKLSRNFFPGLFL
jgi:hypothetical protein